ncbi:DUF4247 domain-containing protein [Paenibacillus ginsengarvi]|uniref:DUF4247 domain-containing protein n=1 Tax=Paenibacillus ginsengarvi TaxID=400777 RepID=A0A3B0CLA6_9BACL|nr:DUF4247 domain-containing protein [Paenibacillus ginsengarvi]RKN85009.1 DUF4247 domain-containing protein [Paenibacillus ginsengarvi]
MKRWNRWAVWISMLLVVALLSGCANAASYVKDSYPLVDMDGKGKAAAKVYEAEGKTVPEVAKELSAQEKPQETSKEDPEQMFLVYDNRIVNLQKNPEKPENTLIEIDTIEYAKQHYDSSFLEGYVTATIIQSIFGNGWWDSSYKKYSTPYKGYSSTPKASTSASKPNDDQKSPTTSDRSGSFTTKGNVSSGSSTSSGSTGSTSAKPGTSSGTSSSASSGSSKSPSSGSSSSTGSSKSSSGNWSTSSSSSSSSSIRKNDGSTPSATKSTKPSTSSRSGSFSTKSSGKRR